MGRQIGLFSSMEGSHIDDNLVTCGGTDGCSGVLVLKKRGELPQTSWERWVLEQEGASGMSGKQGRATWWQDGTLGSVSLGMPWSQLLD